MRQIYCRTNNRVNDDNGTRSIHQAKALPSTFQIINIQANVNDNVLDRNKYTSEYCLTKMKHQRARKGKQSGIDFLPIRPIVEGIDSSAVQVAFPQIFSAFKLYLPTSS